MALTRHCSKTACGRRAVATLTYVYAEQTIVLGALATYAEPHSYDLCGEHATRLTAPRGWDVVRLEVAHDPPDDLVALAEAVRERHDVDHGVDHGVDRGDGAARARGGAVTRSGAGPEQGSRARRESSAAARSEVGRRGHLRVLRDP